MKKIITALVFLAFMTQLHAQQAAKVFFSSGKSTLSRHNKTQIIHRGTRLQSGDAVHTTTKAKVKLRYDNGSVVTLFGNTDYKILSYTPKSDYEINAELTKGKANITTAGVKHKKEILKTNVVALAIIGTEVTIEVVNCDVCKVNLVQGLVKVNGSDITPGNYDISNINGKVTIKTSDGQVVLTDTPPTSIQDLATGNIDQLVLSTLAIQQEQIAPIPIMPPVPTPPPLPGSLEIVCLVPPGL